MTDTKSYENFFKDGDFKNHIINEKNIPITVEFIESIFKKYKLKHKVKNLENFQLAMVHISYLNRTTLTEKTAKILKDVIPISDENRLQAMSLQDKCYGRLEYLGDAVIHCIFAEYLFSRYPGENEGFLTNLRAKLEKADSLSELSIKIGLHKYAIVARNIDQCSGRLENTHLTEDIFEAFFGALSLEASYDKCKSLLISIIEAEKDMAEVINIDDNYKDKLMQYFHQMKWNDPKYCEDLSQQKTIKDGCQEIRSYTTYIKNVVGKIIGVGIADSKIKSQQEAAHNALITLGAIKTDDNTSDYYGEASSQDDEDSDYFEEK